MSFAQVPVEKVITKEVVVEVEKHLDLGQNFIGDEGVGRLAAVLAQCTSLAHLELGRNVIEADGAGRLAAVLAQCTSLAHLNLQGNMIGADGAGRLAAVLGQCALLAHLNLQGNMIGADGAYGSRNEFDLLMSETSIQGGRLRSQARSSVYSTLAYDIAY